MARSEAAQKEMQEVGSIYGAPPQTSRGLEPAKGERAIALQAKVTELHQRMLDIGNRPATILSIRPAQVQAQGQHACNYPVPACPIGQKYQKVVIPSYEVDVVTNKHGEEDVREVLAIKIAEDIKQQNNKNGYRGIVIYMGDRDPEDYQITPDSPQKRNLMAEIKTEEELMVKEFVGRVQQAEDEWAKSDGKGRKNIDDRHRIAAKYLLFKKLLTKQPPWLLETRTLADIPDPCPFCGAEPPKGVLQCKGCFNWLKPIEAYNKGLFTLEDPNGRLALQRLSKKELEELGIYPAVRPFAEVNAAILAEAKKNKA